jgi:hypothetical protein
VFLDYDSEAIHPALFLLLLPYVLDSTFFESQTMQTQGQETHGRWEMNKHWQNHEGPKPPVNPPQVSGNESSPREGWKVVQEVQQIPCDGLLSGHANVREQDPETNYNHGRRDLMDVPIEVRGRRSASADSQYAKHQWQQGRSGAL